MFTKVLIANRGAIACRIERTLNRMGVASVAVHSEADRDSLHVEQADEAICIGPAQAAKSYLDADTILRVARETGAQAIHPGYGFLSENASFAEACEAAGIAFLGPTADQMRVFGLKHSARAQALSCGVPLLPGTGLLSSVEEACAEAARIGYPVMLKSTAGGGGIGMRRVQDEVGLREAWDAVADLAQANFKDAGMYLEKLVVRARHVEVQIFGDGHGKVIALGTRDCSAQRRNQKVVEEAPAPGLSDETREKLEKTAIALGASVNYRSAGTVEYVLDADTGEAWFLEVNTRLQVEHGVTEEIFGVDLVEWMIRCGTGDTAFLDREYTSSGHSIQARVYAEDPARAFAPSCGLLTEALFPARARIETWVRAGTEVPPWYDPMVAKVIVRGTDRAEALSRLDVALRAVRIGGITTNIPFVRQILANTEFAEGRMYTGLLALIEPAPRTLEVLAGGAQTTVQDWPGRQGLWDVGVPPSGPMDDLSFRLGNEILGNEVSAAGLEFVLKGPTLKAHTTVRAVLTGADFGATLDGVLIPCWQTFVWKAGQTLSLPKVVGAGARGYLLVERGIDVPEHLGSRATFTLGGFGGHGGRALRTGDQLPVYPTKDLTSPPASVPEARRPELVHAWKVGALLGPHTAPDYFLPEDLEDFFNADWSVHYNSDRTGVRLVGPKPRWARADGGEAGLHPSNLHDNAYVPGTVDFTGDMPVILGPDGPSLGGFACPVTIALAELWKTGQLRAGDTVRFVPLKHDQARDLHDAPSPAKTQSVLASASPWTEVVSETIVHRATNRAGLPDLCIRQDGDDALLIEFGPMVLDLSLRLRAQALLQALQTVSLEGITELTPGIRSLQVRFDPLRLRRAFLLERLLALESALPDLEDLEFESRTVWLPLSWDDPATRLAIEKYTSTVRPDAPWCPSNIEFIRRVNGLESIEDVKRIVYEAEYLVMGLGDVYLGAPVATPIDPRHRLVTTKYNPARTWTAENSVGIGGAYMCVYGMEGPGGYQFVGRTIQMWNRWRTTPEFAKPWLLRFFDRIRFYEVSAEELLRMREEFPRGRLPLKIEPGLFRWKDQKKFLSEHAESITAFQTTQRQAFAEERARWDAQGVSVVGSQDASVSVGSDAIPEGCEAVLADLPGSVWKVLVEKGQPVEEGQVVAILESMKMEAPVTAPRAGVVREVRAVPGTAVASGQVLVVLE